MSKKNEFFLRDLRLTWWQAGLFKLATISFGIILAINFYEFFAANVSLIWITFIAPGLYIAYIYFKK